MQYPTNIRSIRVMCSGTVSPHHILKAFQKGVDGVFIGGCHIGDCHYLAGNFMTKKRVAFMKELLAFTGLEPERLRVEWISSAEGPEFAKYITEFVQQVRELGPNPLLTARAA